MGSVRRSSWFDTAEKVKQKDGFLSFPLVHCLFLQHPREQIPDTDSEAMKDLMANPLGYSLNMLACNVQNQLEKEEITTAVKDGRNSVGYPKTQPLP